MKTQIRESDFDSRQRYYLRQGKDKMITLIKEYFNSEKSELPKSLKIDDIDKLTEVTLSCICCIEENRTVYKSFIPGCYKLLCNIIENENEKSSRDFDIREITRKRKDNLTLMKNTAGVPAEHHNFSVFDLKNIEKEFSLQDILAKIKHNDYIDQVVNYSEDEYTNTSILLSACNYLIEQIHAKDPDNYQQTSIKYMRFSDFMQKVNLRELDNTNEYLISLRHPKIVFIEGLDLSVLNPEKKYLFEDMMKQRKLRKNKTFYTEA